MGEPTTLYTAKRKSVISYSSNIPVYTSKPLKRSVNSPHAFECAEVGVDLLPIKRFCFTLEDGRVENRFVAFDRELEGIIQVMLDDYTRDLQYGYKKAREDLTKAFESHIKTLESRTVWDIVKVKLSHWWLSKSGE